MQNMLYVIRRGGDLPGSLRLGSQYTPVDFSVLIIVCMTARNTPYFPIYNASCYVDMV
jgi:hypothetical protein